MTTKKPVKKPVKKLTQDPVNSDAAITARAKKGQAEKKRIDDKAKAAQKKTTLNKEAPKARAPVPVIEEGFLQEKPKMVQPNLYGAADQILNTLETALAYWKKQYAKFMNKKEKAETQIDEALEIINDISLSIKGTVDHAPKSEDPAPPAPKKPAPATDLEKEFRKPDLMPTLDKVVKVGMLLQPDYQADKLIVEEIMGPKDTVQSSITFTLVSCPPCFTLLLSDPSKGTAVYVHNLIMCDERIQSIFLAEPKGFDIVAKVDKAGKDPY